MAQSGQYFTILYGILDTAALTFRFVRAGHPDPIHITGSRAVIFKNLGNLPVGMIENVVYQEDVIRLSKGDKIILYTDGLNEATDPLGKQFGSERILEVLSAPIAGRIQNDIESLHQQVNDFGAALPKKDDMTILGFQIL
jgi:serine phosphatase RsbU (regulator of sigma subunit)